MHCHTELRDFTATLFCEVCSEVAIEPDLQPLSSETMHGHSAIVTDEARLDVKTHGFWGAKHLQDYFDVKVFNPYATTYRKQSFTMVYSQLEQLKRRLYDQCFLKVEHGSFTPLIFSSTGGLGRTANITF